MSTIEVVCAIFAIGVLSGLRALSPIAVVCWLGLLHRLPVTGWASFVGTKVAVGLFSLGDIPGRCVHEAALLRHRLPGKHPPGAVFMPIAIFEVENSMAL